MANIFGFGGAGQSQYAGSSFGRGPAIPRRRPMFGAAAQFKMNQMQQQANQGRQVFGPTGAMGSNIGFGQVQPQSGSQAGGFGQQLSQAISDDFLAGQSNITADFLDNQAFTDLLASTAMGNFQTGLERLEDKDRRADEAFAAGQERIARQEELQGETAARRQQYQTDMEESFGAYEDVITGATRDTERAAKKYNSKMQSIASSVRNAGKAGLEQVHSVLDKMDVLINDETSAEVSAQIAAAHRSKENNLRAADFVVDPSTGQPIPETVRQQRKDRIDMEFQDRLQGVIANTYDQQRESKLGVLGQRAQTYMLESQRDQAQAGVAGQIKMRGAEAELAAENQTAAALTRLAGEKMSFDMQMGQMDVSEARQAEEDNQLINQMEQANMANRQVLASESLNFYNQLQTNVFDQLGRTADSLFRNRRSTPSRANALTFYASIMGSPGAGNLPPFEGPLGGGGGGYNPYG